MKEAMFDVVQTCEVDVDNTEWENSDKKLKEEFGKVDGKLTEFEKRLGDNQGNLSDEIKSISGEKELRLCGVHEKKSLYSRCT